MVSRFFLIGLVPLFLLASCGGSGGSSSAPTAVVPAPTPTPTLSPVANRAPTIVFSGSTAAPENTTAVIGRAVASDPDGDALTFSLNGPDAARYRISATGEIAFASPPDFETPTDADGNNRYDAEIVVSDGKATAAIAFGIDVTNLGAREFVADISYPDITPTVEQPVAALKVSAERWLIRTLSVEGGARIDFDEFVMIVPNGTPGLEAGWQLVQHHAEVSAKLRQWNTLPARITEASTQEFAWRMGEAGAVYRSGGDGPDFYYAGFGHGHMRYRASSGFGASTISLDDRDELIAAPVGTAVYGSKLDFGMNYALLLGNGREVAIANMHHEFGAQGLIETIRIGMTAGGVAGNDSYLILYPFNGANRVKPVGLAAVAITGDGRVKGDWDQSDIREIQFYNSDDQTVAAVQTAAFGAPVRRAGGTIAPFSLNACKRYAVVDGIGLAKFYSFALSSECDDPKTAVALEGTYESQNRIHTRIRGAGLM